MIELDAAVNKWFDTIPNHREYLCLAASNVPRSCDYQLGGTRKAKARHAHDSRVCYTLRIIGLNIKVAVIASSIPCLLKVKRSTQAIHFSFRHSLDISVSDDLRKFCTNDDWSTRNTASSTSICCSTSPNSKSIIFSLIHTFIWTNSQGPLFDSAIVLLINLWRGLRNLIALDPSKELDYVRRCIDILSMYEKRYVWESQLSHQNVHKIRYQAAGRLWFVSCRSIPVLLI